MILRVLSAVFLTLLLALPGAAQVSSVPAEWQQLVERAASVLDDGQASDAALEVLRSQVADWRNRLQETQQADRGRIETLRNAIEALGPVPEDGVETDEVVAIRTELNARLESLLGPVRTAQAAFSASEGLIAEIDAMIEGRRRAAMFEQESPPLNPARWWPAASAAGLWFGEVSRQLVSPFSNANERALLRQQGIPMGVYVVVAMLLILRSGVWIGRLRDRLAVSEASSPVARIGLLLLSLARMILPYLGVIAAMRVIALTGAESLAVSSVIQVVPQMALCVLAARWLGLQAFPLREDAPVLIPVAQARRGEGRFHAMVLGATFALKLLVDAMAASSSAVAAQAGVLMFALSLITGVTLVRLGQLLLAEGRLAHSEGEGGFWAQVMRLAGQALMAAGVGAPLAIGLGYVALGEAVLWPSILSVALFVAIGAFQNFIFDAYAALSRQEEAARDALAPTLVVFALALLSVPLFALVWGVRPERLVDGWLAFLGGISLGGTTLSPRNFLTFALVFGTGYAATRLIKGVLRSSVLPKTRLDSGGTNAILSGTGYVGITLAALLAITTAGIDLSGLAIVAGALSVGVGFGLQTIVQNFVSGIILLIERPIKIGDWIAVNGMEGFVRQISVRSTRIETFDRQDVIIPNADLIAGVVTNYTLGNSSGRVLVPVGVAYGTDTRRVEAILREITEAHPMVVLNPPPVITFEGFGADSLDFLIRAVLRDVLWKVIVKSEINHAIAERFRDEGIEIPFAQRDVWLRNPEVLHQTKPTDPETA
ncbi:MAG: mechanosensitive ion channel domain-containing protein [Jannaschia sp.]